MIKQRACQAVGKKAGAINLMYAYVLFVGGIISKILAAEIGKGGKKKRATLNLRTVRLPRKRLSSSDYMCGKHACNYFVLEEKGRLRNATRQNRGSVIW